MELTKHMRNYSVPLVCAHGMSLYAIIDMYLLNYIGPGKAVATYVRLPGQMFKGEHVLHDGLVLSAKFLGEDLSMTWGENHKGDRMAGFITYAPTYAEANATAADIVDKELKPVLEAIAAVYKPIECPFSSTRRKVTYLIKAKAGFTAADVRYFLDVNPRYVEDGDAVEIRTRSGVNDPTFTHYDIKTQMNGGIILSDTND